MGDMRGEKKKRAPLSSSLKSAAFVWPKNEDVLAPHSPEESMPGPLPLSQMSCPLPSSPQILGEWRPAPLVTPAPRTSVELTSVSGPLTDAQPWCTDFPPRGGPGQELGRPLLVAHNTPVRDSLPALEPLRLLEPHAFRLPAHAAELALERGAAPSPLLGLVPGGQERFECLDCHRAYFTFSGLAKHRQLRCEWQCHRCFSCKYCDKEYVSLGALKMHIRTHTLPCVCKLCGKAFSRPWLLQGHIRTHTGEKPFSCPHCSRAFADRSNLRAHLQTHSDIKKYQCKRCSKTFSRISLLSKHEEAGCCPLS
ncbi:zinc finger protein SNAI3 isoform X1 [Anguilla anguilla]|uniref:zinc finger protein SNAI3 isoform X1 n=1 Tax=Anguilla anguilla TaxID=7936 RepID=UPI0015AA7F2D|nr:zinc finger protein SNAI3 isoform X1 [Anguilla anguilla]